MVAERTPTEMQSQKVTRHDTVENRADKRAACARRASGVDWLLQQPYQG